jgi:hypothetical protein
MRQLLCLNNRLDIGLGEFLADSNMASNTPVTAQRRYHRSTPFHLPYSSGNAATARPYAPSTPCLRNWAGCRLRVGSHVLALTEAIEQ